MQVKKPDGTPYCEFSVDEKLFTISFLEGSNLNEFSVSLDKKVLPDLKKFLESLKPSDTKTVITSVCPLDISEKVLKGKEQKGLDLREVLEKFSIPRNSSRK